jgi:hypothetical protein
MDELEKLNREAWRKGKYFIIVGETVFRTISPEVFQEQRRAVEMMLLFVNACRTQRYG